MSSHPLVLSIHPNYADAIFAGRKRFELRRVMPRVVPGATIYVYATAPVSAVVGFFEAGDVRRDSRAAIWRDLRDELAIEKKDYDRYFSGCRIVSAVRVIEPRLLRRPAPLPELRGVSPTATFTAPQSSVRVKDDVLRQHLEALSNPF